MAIDDPGFLAGRPIVYEMPTGRKILISLVCGLVALSAILIALMPPYDDVALKGLVCLLALVVAGYVLYATFRNRLSLYVDRFEYRTARQTETIYKNDITGFRAYHTRDGKRLIFITRTSGRVTTPDYRDNHALFREWLADLPDMDALDAAAYTKSLEENPAFGADAGQRKKAVVFHRKVVGAVNMGAFVAAFWLYIFGLPKIPLELVCMVLPVVVLAAVALSGGRYTLFWGKAQGRIGLAPAFLAPMVALAVSSFGDDSLLDAMPALYLALACAGIGILLVVIIERRAPFQGIAVLTVCLIAGCWADLRLVDVVIDHSKPQVEAAEITDMTVISHRHGPDEHRLYLNILDQPNLPATVNVDKGLYERIHVGESLCVGLHKGALGYRWLDYAKCPNPA